MPAHSADALLLDAAKLQLPRGICNGRSRCLGVQLSYINQSSAPSDQVNRVMSFFVSPRPQPIPNNNPPFGGSAAYLVDNISFGGGSNFGSSIDISPASRARGPFGCYTPPYSASDKRGFNKTPDSVKLKFFAKFERYVYPSTQFTTMANRA